jgi:hypothetical protein
MFLSPLPHFCTTASTKDDTLRLFAALESFDVESYTTEPKAATVWVGRGGDSLKRVVRKGALESLTANPEEVEREPRRDAEAEEVREDCLRIREAKSICGDFELGEKRIGRRRPSINVWFCSPSRQDSKTLEALFDSAKTTGSITLET